MQGQRTFFRQNSRVEYRNKAIGTKRLRFVMQFVLTFFLWAFVYAGTASAQSCAPGTFSVNGMEPCTPCSAGTFASVSGSTTCAACSPGTFQDALGQASCQQCPVDTFASVFGSTTCTDCPPGTFAPDPGSTACSPSSDTDEDGVPDGEDDCPDSDLRLTVLIDECNAGVSNTVFPNGCTISDLIASCAEGASNHGQFVSCVSHVTNDLKKAGTITGQQKGAIQRCAAQADIP